MALDKASEFEQEYDNRYEGLDFDDVDAYPKALDDESEGPTQPASQYTAPYDDGKMNTLSQEEIAIEKLLRAETELNATLAAANAHEKLEQRLESSDPRIRQSAPTRCSAQELVTYHEKIQRSLASNPALVAANTNAVAATLILSAIPRALSRATAQSKVSSAVRSIAKASSIEELYTQFNISAILLDSVTPNQVTSLLSEASVAAAAAAAAAAAIEGSPQEDENAVRALLRLASLPVTSAVLGRTDSAGKKLRKMKQHTVLAVGKAAAAAVEAWKAALATPIV